MFHPNVLSPVEQKKKKKVVRGEILHDIELDIDKEGLIPLSDFEKL